ncbi:hypothetical protein CNYM01_14036 [Colletotrichum nymphaeae SA-01]|uniref:Uncharacterized protein n=1 Tax=Colletotrichum nymphaeae SA-01 TaxID=1460502 RepID=A0A135UQ26_9PEZI|nr:hypothetical protein CNYM01_14036 [Colletotrichum nymphaeae SA-01]
MASQIPKLTNIIHIRDFIDEILPDSTRPETPNYTEIHAAVNVFQEDDFYDSTINSDPIQACIRVYLKRNERDLFVLNAFFYAHGRFTVEPVPDERPKLIVQSLSFQRHPGDVSDFHEYRRHLPEQWCPMMIALGFVGDRKPLSDQPFCLRNFELRTSVYDTSRGDIVNFSIFCYFANTKRWEHMVVPSSSSSVSVTGKLVGCTPSNQLAVRILDVTYLPKTTPSSHSPTSSADSTSVKRQSRWSGRADSTPTKKSRMQSSMDSVQDDTEMIPIDKSDTMTPTPTTQDDTCQVPRHLDSPSSDTESKETTSTISLLPATRPQRHRQPPKHL